MGGGPVDGEEDSSSASSKQNSPSRHLPATECHTVPLQVTSIDLNTQTQACFVRVAPVVNAQELEKPVLTTAVTGGVIGALAGTWLGGMGSVFGTTVGVIAGASLASRDDAIGAHARETAMTLRRKVEGGVTRAVERLNQEPMGRDITAKMSSAVQVLTETTEKYRVNERIDAVAAKVVEVTEPKIRAAVTQVMQKVSEVDSHGFVDTAKEFLQDVDRGMGLSRSVEALNREIRS